MLHIVTTRLYVVNQLLNSFQPKCLPYKQSYISFHDQHFLSFQLKPVIQCESESTWATHSEVNKRDTCHVFRLQRQAVSVVVRSQVLTATSIKADVFWLLSDMGWRFRGLYHHPDCVGITEYVPDIPEDSYPLWNSGLQCFYQDCTVPCWCLETDYPIMQIRSRISTLYPCRYSLTSSLIKRAYSTI
jgi:hypothetical protein